MGVPSGGNLGAAQGSITINTTQAQQAVPVMQGVAAGVTSAMSQVNSSVTKTQQVLGGVASASRQLAGAFGIAFGAAGVAQLVKGAIAADEAAVAYGRQTVAAIGLAGSQAKLNELLATYDQATGGAVDNATALAGVTNSMAQGFADSTEELETFLVGVRGASIAMGKSQEFIIERAQFEMLNQTGQRLNEIGLSMEEVRARAAALRSENQQLTKEQAYQQAVMDSLNDKYGDLAKSSEGARSGIEHVTREWKNLRLEVAQEFHPGFDQLGEATADFLEWIRQRRSETSEADRIMRVAGPPAMRPGVVPSWMTSVPSSSSAPLRPQEVGFSPEESEAWQDWAAERTEIEMAANADILEENNSYQERRASSIADHEQTIARMGEDFARQRERSEADYQRAVADVQSQAAARELKAAEDLAKSIARLNADHAKQQERWQRDLNESIAEAQEDSAERVADATADRDERIAEARADSTKRLAELEEDYTKERERSARDHNNSILEAASNLDAKAIWAEQRRYAQEQADAEDAHQEAVSEEQQRLADFESEQNKAHEKRIAEEGKNLAERIAQEKAAHQQRVADANEAHTQRIADLTQANTDQLAEAKAADGVRLQDMKDAHFLEQTEADTDYGIRLKRLQDDHTDQLTEMTNQHNNRITQIGTHGAAEIRAHDTEFQKRWKQLTGHEFDLELEQFNHQNRMLGDYQDYLDDVEREQTRHQIRMLRLLKETPGLTPAEIKDIDDAITDLGIALRNIGDAATHVDPRVAPIQVSPDDRLVELSGLGGQGFITPPAGGSGGTTVAGMAVTIAPGAIVINAAAGASVAGMGDEFKRQLLVVLKEVAKVG